MSFRYHLTTQLGGDEDLSIHATLAGVFDEIGRTIGTRDAPDTAAFRDDVEAFAFWPWSFEIEAWPDSGGAPVRCDPETAIEALASRHARLPFEADILRRLEARNPKDGQTEET